MRIGAVDTVAALSMLVASACSVREGAVQAGPPTETGVVSLRVVGWDDGPMPGIPVRLQAKGPRGHDQVSATDADGRARFTGLEMGALYTLFITPPVGFYMEAMQEATDPSAPSQEYRFRDLRGGVPLSIRTATAEEEEIAEVVFRALIARIEPWMEKPGCAYHLTLLGKDPRRKFLARLRSDGKNAKAGSQYVPGSGCYDFSLYYIALLPAGTAEVGAGIYLGPLAASGYTYVLAKRDGRWVVQSSVMNWFS